MEITRKQKKEIAIGGIRIGMMNPIRIQSMTNAPSKDIVACTRQLKALEAAGCDIARLAVSTLEECKNIRYFKENTVMPLVADIQYDYRLAIAAIENGVDKIRFNPGNIGSMEALIKLVDCAKSNKTPIRIGVNGGSLEKEFELKYGRTALALAESCLRHVLILEKMGFYDIVLSVKSSNPKITLDANRILNEKTDYPLHLGVTEAGILEDSLIKSSACLGALLLDGIGDTIRISVTGDPVSEITAAKGLLRCLGLNKNYCEIVSCPTCSRCRLDLEKMAREVRSRTQHITKPLRVAVMGCAVNGIGEAKDCDAGIAGGESKSVLFKNGEIIETVENDKMLDRLLELLDKL